MKKITYQGMIEFLLPDSWAVKEDLKNNLILMHPGDDDFTALRLSIIQAKSSKTLTENTYLDLFESFKLYNSEEVTVLNSGDRLTTMVRDSVENNTEVKTIYWLLANLRYPSTVRLATFSFTTIKSNIEETEILSAIGMLDNEIRKSQFI